MKLYDREEAILSQTKFRNGHAGNLDYSPSSPFGEIHPRIVQRRKPQDLITRTSSSRISVPTDYIKTPLRRNCASDDK